MPALNLSTKELRTIILLVALIWVVFIADWFLPLEQLGLKPRSLGGIPGIVAMPFLHHGLGHILGNSVPLVILLSLLALSEEDAAPTVATIVVLGGLLLWLFGRSAVHVGASGLVFGLATYLIVAGYRSRTFVRMAVAGITVLLYGGTLVGGVLPLWPGVSWDGHLTGAIAGATVALVMHDPTAVRTR